MREIRKIRSLLGKHVKDQSGAEGMHSFSAFARKEIGLAVENTAKNYQTAVRKFEEYMKNDDIRVEDMDASQVYGFQRWLLDQGLSRNTSSCYMRSLRTIYRRAIEEYGLERVAEPFRRVTTTVQKTRKRSIKKTDLRRLMELELGDEPHLALARDIFLFSFYAMGIAFIDVVNLKKENVVAGHIEYRRHKTGLLVRVKIEPCMQVIMRKYRQRKSDFLFPILHNSSYTSQLRLYNYRLSRLSALARLSTPITSYVARHTWASMAYNKNVELSVISRGMGHNNPETTLIYIRGINDCKLEKANRGIIESVRYEQ
ncbi:MAG: site-specific integrase [Prevotella sp.]|nr:site-specific integrase [Prevotella sp.]